MSSSFIQNSLRDSSSAMAKMLSALPNEMLAEIVKKLDFKSCMNLRCVSSEFTKLVDTFARFQIEVVVTYVTKGFIEVVVKEDGGNKLMSIEVKKLKKAKHTVAIYDADKQLMHFYSLEKWSMKDACFGTLGRIMQHPIINTTKLTLKMGSYNGKFDLGLKAMKVNLLTLHCCKCRSFVESIFFNYDCIFLNLTYDIGTVERRRFNPAEIMNSRLNHVKHYIIATEEPYKCAFPRSYKVKSHQDGFERIQTFYRLADMYGFPIYEGNEKGQATSRRTILGLMLLRAVFSDDRVDYLRLSYPQYWEQILFLRNGIHNYKVDTATLAILSVLFVLSLLSSRENPYIPKRVYAALRTTIETRWKTTEVGAFEKLLGKVEQLADENWKM